MANLYTPKKKAKKVADSGSDDAEIDDPSNVLYSISNVSPLIRSPSKTVQSSSVTWFEFCVQSKCNPMRRRVSCFDRKVNDYLLSSSIAHAINDPKKGIYIKDLVVDPNNHEQLKWTDETTIGEKVIDIKEPFPCAYAPNQTIQSVLFHVRPKCLVSLLANVSNYRTFTSERTGCVVHKYDLLDATNDITLASRMNS